jgi:hypothetical protein
VIGLDRRSNGRALRALPGPKAKGNYRDDAEIRSSISYLKREFAARAIRVVPLPAPTNYAGVFLGERCLSAHRGRRRGRGSRFDNFEKAITLPGAGRSPKLDSETVAKLNAHLKAQIGEKFSVRKRPTKTDSADLHIGDEFVGVLFADEGGFALEMAILEQDLEP